jgi:hypothetical protein
VDSLSSYNIAEKKEVTFNIRLAFESLFIDLLSCYLYLDNDVRLKLVKKDEYGAYDNIFSYLMYRQLFSGYAKDAPNEYFKHIFLVC